MKASAVTDILFNQLNFSSERQKVISSNIANIDTPNYKTKDIKFKDELLKSKNSMDIDTELKLAITNKAHIQAQNINNNTNKYNVYEVQNLEEQNDGNNVNLDTQMSEMSKNSVLFNALQSSIKKDSSWFKTMIDSSSKN
jgi:flagellar basal-body rod protein FlgB